MSQLATRDKLQEVCETVKRAEFQVQLKQALPASVSVDRFTRVTVVALQQNPDIVTGNRQSLFLALVACARDGLVPDGREAALVKFGDKIGYLPMVGGYRKKAAEHGFSLIAHAVYANDEFTFELGDSPRVKHVPPQDLSVDRGELRGAYAVATRQSDGATFVDVLSKPEIEAIKATSRARNGDLWTKWEGEAYRKSAARRLFKQLPLPSLDERTQSMVEADERAVDVASAVVPEVAGLEPLVEDGGEPEVVE